MRLPLARPSLVAIESPIVWPNAIAVVGAHAEAFARRIASAAQNARVLKVELRHTEGFSIEGDTIHAHPTALVAAIERARDERFTIGVGAPFAAAVRPRVLVWIRGAQHVLSLPEVERDLMRRADLVLEEPRDGVADELADLDRSTPAHPEEP